MNTYHFFAVIILLTMGALMLFSMSQDSLTFDELAHITAGFGYLKEQDYRLNAEHPPLVKYIAALGADLATKPHFPTDTAPWQNETKNQWAQWDHGTIFLYQSGNDADAVIFWSRVPMILLTLLLGILLYIWSYRHIGGLVALLTTALYAFSPTILAHGRYVTTDIGATLGFFIGITTFVSFLENPSWRRFFIAGIAFGIAQLLKFSLILLIPMYGILILVWIWSRADISTASERIRLFFAYAAQTIGIGIVGVAVIWAAYAQVTARYPLDRNMRDTDTLLGTYRFRSHVAFTESLLQNRITQPLGQYLTGALLANQRAAGGNTTYFLGTVSSKGSTWYFPLLYMVKEQLMSHILAAFALAGFLLRIINPPTFPQGIEPRGKDSKPPFIPAARPQGILEGGGIKLKAATSAYNRARAWIASHFELVGAVVVIGVYWTISLVSPLNIGLRHVLPTFPFIYILIAYGIQRFLTTDASGSARWRTTRIPHMLYAVTLLLLASVAIRAYPYYLSYYNALGGRTENGYQIAVDSNYDWGQDFKRLRAYMDEHGIETIALDYFGGAARDYYLPDRVDGWWSARGTPQGYFAISSTLREGALASWAEGLTPPKPEEAYPWLRGKEPIGRAGMSIFIYKFP